MAPASAEESGMHPRAACEAFLLHEALLEQGTGARDEPMSIREDARGTLKWQGRFGGRSYRRRAVRRLEL